MAFNFVRIYATLQMTANISDPYALFGIKALLPDAFRKSICCCHCRCDRCTVTDCPGFLAFSQPLTSDPAALRRYQKPSPPFVFDIPLLPPLPNIGTLCTLGITLIGEAVNHCSAYLQAIRSIFGADNHSLPATVVRFESAGYGADRYPLEIRGMEGLVILSDDGVLKSRVFQSPGIQLEFITPLRIIQEGKPVRLLPASLLLRSLMRRISSLAYYYGADEMDVDFKWLAQQTEQAYWKRTDFRVVNWGHPTSGLIGDGVLGGVVPEFHYFLALGEFFHLGKGAPWGLGKFLLSG